MSVYEEKKKGYFYITTISRDAKYILSTGIQC